MTDLLLSIPENLDTPEQAAALAQLYRAKDDPATRLRRLEEQAVFLMVSGMLQDQSIQSVCLAVPDDEEDSITVELMMDGEEDPIEVYDENDPDAGNLYAFLQEVHPNYGSEFIQTLTNPVTRDNQWQVARKLLGKKVAARLEQQHMASTTALAAGKPKAPRL